MASSNRWLCALTGAALLCATSGMPGATSFAQQSGAQPPAAPRDDPATSGAGPTSGAPGQLDYDRPKGAPPSTTDSRGVTTTHPKAGDAKPAEQAPRDQGNESMSTIAPK
jgi:hypothetical protein